MRRRLTKQIEDAKLFGIQGFCKDLLNVSDILQRATESVPTDQVGSNPHLKNLYQGLSMTESELQNVNNLLFAILSELVLHNFFITRFLSVTVLPKWTHLVKNLTQTTMKLCLNRLIYNFTQHILLYSY